MSESTWLAIYFSLGIIFMVSFTIAMFGIAATLTESSSDWVKRIREEDRIANEKEDRQ